LNGTPDRAALRCPAGARAQKGDKVLNGKDGMRGIYWTEDQFFVPGTTGSEWPRPEFEDIERINFAETDPQKQITDWQTTSWAEVNCCRQLRGTDIWEHKDTGVPDCICRDFLEKTGQKSVAFCSLRQSCENALRDWNKVFGEGYMAKGGKGDWNTESPARCALPASPPGRCRPRPAPPGSFPARLSVSRPASSAAPAHAPVSICSGKRASAPPAGHPTPRPAPPGC
jgi:hypothetical protein